MSLPGRFPEEEEEEEEEKQRHRSGPGLMGGAVCGVGRRVGVNPC